MINRRCTILKTLLSTVAPSTLLTAAQVRQKETLHMFHTKRSEILKMDLVVFRTSMSAMQHGLVLYWARSAKGKQCHVLVKTAQNLRIATRYDLDVDVGGINSFCVFQ